MTTVHCFIIAESNLESRESIPLSLTIFPPYKKNNDDDNDNLCRGSFIINVRLLIYKRVTGIAFQALANLIFLFTKRKPQI